MAVDVVGTGQRELFELVWIARDNAGEVHHLGKADHAAAAHQALEVAGGERAPRRLELRRGHRRRRHHVDVERQLRACVEEPVDAVGAEHVCDLVRVDHDRRRPERQHELRELVDEQLGRLQVHVGVDEPRDDEAAQCVERLLALVVAEAGDVAVDDRDVRFEPFAREDRQHLAAANDEIGGLVAPRHRQPSCQVHCMRR